MRCTGSFVLMFSAGLLVLGCGKDTSSTPDTKAKIANAEEKIKSAVNATEAAAIAKRDEYARELHKRLDELDVKYHELRVRAGKAEAQAKTGLEKKLDEAGIKRDVTAKKLHELKEAGADRWEKIKESVESAFDDLKKAID